MTKELKERLEQQLAEVRSLIADLDAISCRLRVAADTAMDNMLNKKGYSG